MSFRILILVAMSVSLLHGTFAQGPELKSAAVVRCTSRPLPSTPVAGVLASDGERVYAGTANGSLYSFESKDLTLAWRVEVGGEFVSGILLAENAIVIATNQSGKENSADGSTIRLLSKESGVTTWSAKLPYSDKYYLGRINGSVAAISNEGQITLIDRPSGQIQIQAGPFGKLSAKPAFSPTNALIATLDKNLMVISARTGSLVFKQTTEFTATAVGFLKDDNVVAGDERGNVILFGARETRSVWKFKSGGGVTFVFEAAGGILVTSLDNFVYLISDYNGDVVWKRRLTGRVVEGGLAIENSFVVLINGENSAFVIDLLKGKVTDTISASDTDLVNRVPVYVRDRFFVLSSLNALELYSLSGCVSK